MDWYVVVKTIKGRRYRYRQKTWREGKRVRTLSEYVSAEVIVGYHGTFAKFERFSSEYLGSANDCDSSHEGFFFASNPKVAASYASTQLARQRSLEAKILTVEARVRTMTGMDYFYGAQSAFEDGKFDPDLSNKLRHFFRMRDRAQVRLFTNKITKVTVSKRAQVKKCVLDLKNPYVHNMGGRGFDDEEFWDAATNAKEGGHDGVIIRRTYDPGSCPSDAAVTDVYIVFDPDQISTVDR